MPFVDYDLATLEQYKPARVEQADFDAFWQRTLSEARQHPLNATFAPADFGMTAVETYDVTFNGYGGQPIKAWLILPANRSGKVPCVVEFLGYGGGRGFPTGYLRWACAGFAHLLMDTRGQGSRWQNGDTPDPEPEGSNPQHPGFMTRGVLNPNTYYYRRVFTDGVRAVEAAASHPAIDASKIAVTGGSQGGGITLAVAALSSQVIAAMPDVPFLCHYRRATQLIATDPYNEITMFCRTHRDKIEQVFTTLSYFDGVNLGTRAKVPALFSVGLMDDICPPSTVYAAYNHYAGKKQIAVWEYNNHEGGGNYQFAEQLKFLKSVLSA